MVHIYSENDPFNEHIPLRWIVQLTPRHHVSFHSPLPYSHSSQPPSIQSAVPPLVHSLGLIITLPGPQYSAIAISNCPKKPKACRSHREDPRRARKIAGTIGGMIEPGPFMLFIRDFKHIFG